MLKAFRDVMKHKGLNKPLLFISAVNEKAKKIELK